MQHFIDIKAGKSGPMSNAIIWNPHLAIRYLHEQKTPGLTEATYNSLVEWALEVGAKDMTDPFPVVGAAPPAPAVVPMPAAPIAMPTVSPLPPHTLAELLALVPPDPATEQK